jgi:CRP-like cAMP-binding protein
MPMIDQTRQAGEGGARRGLPPADEPGRTQGQAAMASAAIAQARASAREAEARWRRERVDRMLAQIADGRERDAAIYEARVLGVRLQEIGSAIGLTRERVRQICNRYRARATINRPPANAASGGRPADAVE